MLENSLKSSAYFDLSHGSFYEANADALVDLDVKSRGLQTKAVFQVFRWFAIFVI